MNKSILSGRLAKDIELRYSQDGIAILKNIIAVNKYPRQEGQPTADFIPIVAFGKTAEAIEKYSGKGKKLMISGKIQTGSYENAEGKKVYTTEVVVDEVEFNDFKDQAQTAYDFGSLPFISENTPI